MTAYHDEDENLLAETVPIARLVVQWFELTGDARLGACATQGCGGQPTWRLEAGGAGSDYCSGCKNIIARDYASRALTSGEQ